MDRKSSEKRKGRKGKEEVRRKRWIIHMGTLNE